ncbi:hypothetical protein CCACVL1_29867 [Corchorus capsularis]|uniref:Uncharacterized protein n=1 Tax=Corchorus capsularis TaxID=210143 RepID=A0A1R3FZM2_COCAP|nr:hypothetical protein CCACVL1_29867 [Corchorus capsularis]
MSNGIIQRHKINNVNQATLAEKLEYESINIHIPVPDALRAYHGLEGHMGANEDHEDVIDASLEEHGDGGTSDRPLLGEAAQHRPRDMDMTGYNRPNNSAMPGHNRPRDPLSMPLGPITRARAKRFKEALVGFIRSHLEEIKIIEDSLGRFEDHTTRNIPNDSMLCTLLSIDEH